MAKKSMIVKANRKPKFKVVVDLMQYLENMESAVFVLES